MGDALEDHRGSVNIGGGVIINFRFAEVIVVNAEEEEEPGDIVTIYNLYKVQDGDFGLTR